MKVIVVNDHINIDGGADAVAVMSADALARAGADVTFLAADRVTDASIPPDHAFRLVTTGQSDLLRDPNRMRVALQGLWNLKAARALGRLLDESDPRNTIVHLHSWTKSLSSSVVRTALVRRFKVICTLHDYFTACPNGTFFDVNAMQVCTRVPLSGACVSTNCDTRSYGHKVYRVVRQAIQQRAGRIPSGIEHFIAVSRFSLRILEPYLGKSASVDLVRNPIFPARRPPADVSRNSAFAMIGRMSVQKGPRLFLQACKDAGVDAVCVGDDPQLESLRAQFPGARFAGHLPPQQVAEEIGAARALVLPSLSYETQGLVVLEAAALGVPALVSQETAGREFVEDGVTGLWFRTGDVNDLARALRRLDDDPVLAARLGREAYDRYWADPPTPQRHAMDLLAVYARILGAQETLDVPLPRQQGAGSAAQ